MKRTHISLKTKLAAALLEVDRLRYITQSKPRLISYEHSKIMDDDAIIARWNWDHYPHRHADGGPSRAWNLVPIPALEHREKTAKVDVPEMAKSKRIRRKQALHTARMSTDSWGDVDRAIAFLGTRRHIPSRPFPKIKRKFANKRGN